MKNELAKKAGQIKTLLTNNSPMILTSLSVAGLVTTSVMAVKATPKAMHMIALAENTKYEVEEISKLTKKELIKATWKCYIPATIMGGLTIACLISAHNINNKRNAALAGLYSLTEKSLKEYQSKVVEVIGESKETKIRDEVAKDQLKDNAPNPNGIIITGKGDALCYDSLSGRYFKSDIESIKKVLNKLSRDLMTDMFVTLNDIYYELGLTSTKLGDLMGWHIDDGLIEPDFSSQLTDDGTPCLVLNFNVEPRYINFD